MANGIGNNELRKKKINTPAGQEERSNVTVSSFADTHSKGITGFKGIETRDQLKSQIRKGEYVTIKLSDKPIEIKKEDKEETNKKGGTDRE